MTEVISVKFKSRGKTYFFAPGDIAVPDGVQVIVETSKGLELADCISGNHFVVDERIVPPLRPVIRVATEDDLRIAELCKAREKEAFAICEKKISQHGLDMKLVDVECNFEGNKILFFFTSDGRVDFRELVKDLAGVFRTRIELRQIGVRDEAKMLGGLGICGRPFCCNQFLGDFQPVSTKMAKTQSLSLNPAKISGTCGRLMCCLRYEQDAYEELVKTVPKNGAFVETPNGYGNVVQVNLLRQKVKVAIDGDDSGLKSYEADEVAAIPGGRPKPGESLPHILQIKAKPVKKEEPEEASWNAPVLFGDMPEAAPEKKPDAAAPLEKPFDAAARETDEKKKPNHRPRRKKPAAKPEPEKAAKPDAASPKPEIHADKTGEAAAVKPFNPRHRQHRKPAPQNGEAPKQVPQTPKQAPQTPKQPSQTPKPPRQQPASNPQRRTAPQGEKTPQHSSPKPASAERAPGAEGEAKSKSASRRRFYKPKPKQGGAPGAQS